MKAIKHYVDNTTTDASILKSEALNSYLSELSNAVTNLGFTLEPASTTQLATTLDYAGKSWLYDVDPINSNSYLIAIKKGVNNNNIEKLVNGMVVAFMAIETNTETEIKLKINQLASKPIKFINPNDYTNLLEPLPKDLKRGYTYTAQYSEQDDVFKCQVISHGQTGNNTVTLPMMAAIQSEINELRGLIGSGGIEVGDITIAAHITDKLGFFRCEGQQVLGTDYPLLYAKYNPRRPVPRANSVIIVPDIRGRFIRGTDYPIQIKTYPGQATGGYLDTGRNIATYQTDKIRNHYHKTGNLTFRWLGSNNITAVAQQDAQGATSVVHPIYAEPLSLEPSNVENSGTNETRPVNFSVYFFMKHD